MAFIILIIFLNIMTLHMINCSCNEYENCFECVSQKNCKWNLNCITNDLFYSEWYTKYSQCDNDLISINLMKTYCNNDSLQSNSLPITFELQQIDKKYGYKNLFCKYIIEVPFDKKSFNFNFTLLNTYETMKDDLYGMIIYDYNFSLFKHILINDSYFLSSLLVKKIEFFYYSPSGPHNQSPFILSALYDDSNQLFDSIYIVIGVLVSLIIAIIVIGLIIVSIRYCKRKRSLNSHYLFTINSVPNSIDLQEKKAKNLLILNQIYQPFSYDITQTFHGTTCTICIEDFIPDNSVLVLRCKHIFHYQCLQNYWKKNLLSPKCPNCNDDLLNTCQRETCQNMQRDFNGNPTIINIERNIETIENRTEFQRIPVIENNNNT